MGNRFQTYPDSLETNPKWLIYRRRVFNCFVVNWETIIFFSVSSTYDHLLMILRAFSSWKLLNYMMTSIT